MDSSCGPNAICTQDNYCVCEFGYQFSYQSYGCKRIDCSEDNDCGWNNAAVCDNDFYIKGQCRCPVDCCEIDREVQQCFKSGNNKPFLILIGVACFVMLASIMAFIVKLSLNAKRAISRHEQEEANARTQQARHVNISDAPWQNLEPQHREASSPVAEKNDLPPSYDSLFSSELK